MPAFAFSVNEFLTLFAGFCASCWFVWRRRGRPQRPCYLVWPASWAGVVCGVLVCRLCLADWPRVPTASMAPTLRAGDVVWLNHLAYGPRLPFTNTAWTWGSPARGDIVVFRHPQQASTWLVKRVVGLPGDVLDFKDGLVAVAGAANVNEFMGMFDAPTEDLGYWHWQESAGAPPHSVKINPFVMGRLPLALDNPSLARQCQSARDGQWQCRVPAGHYLMLGDNRDHSEDTRVWGWVPLSEIYGRVDRVLFNPHDWARRWLPLREGK